MKFKENSIGQPVSGELAPEGESRNWKDKKGRGPERGCNSPGLRKQKKWGGADTKGEKVSGIRYIRPETLISKRQDQVA